MATITKLKPGQRVYERSLSKRIGQKWDEWPVDILEVDLGKGRVLAKWNYNPPRWYYQRSIAQWRLKEVKG